MEKLDLIKTDVLVVGAGVSGLCAAAAASKAGKNVCLVERDSLDKISGFVAEDFFAVENNEGISDIYKELMSFENYLCDPLLLREAVFESGAAFEWCKSNGFISDVVLNPENTAKVNVVDLCTAILKYLRCSGNVSIMENTACTNIMFKNGAATGARIVCGEDKAEIEAGITILACGGHAANRELLGKTIGEKTAANIICGTSDDGGMMEYAWKLGAGKKGQKIVHGGGVAVSENAPAANALIQKPILWLNRHGRRFVRENIVEDPIFCSNAVLYQKGFAWAIYNDAAIAARTVGCDAFKSELNDLIATGNAAVSEDLAGLAAKTGMDEDKLTASVKKYNEAVKSGNDGEYFKAASYLTESLENGPYYALKMRVVVTDTEGGIEVGKDFTVTDKNSKPMQGLMACGAMAGGPHFVSYSRQAGFPLTWAVLSGMIAGTNAGRM